MILLTILVLLSLETPFIFMYNGALVTRYDHNTIFELKFSDQKSTALQQSKIPTTQNQFKRLKAISAFIRNLVTRRNI